MLIKFDFSSKTVILVVKFAFATANLKIETLRMRRRFARVLEKSDSLGMKSRRKRLWDYLGGRRVKQTWQNLVWKVIAWIVVVTARF